MKRVFIVLTCLALFSEACHAQFRVGTGYAFESVRTRWTSSQELSKLNQNGVFIEGLYSTRESENISVTYGLRLSYLQATRNVFKDYNLSVPFHLDYQKPSGEITLLASVGPTVNYTLSHLMYGKKNESYWKDNRRFDVRMGASAGASWKRFEGRLYYDIGLIDRCKNSSYDKIHTNQFRIGIAYNL